MEQNPDMRYEVDGRQVVTVGQYSYLWAGTEPLAVGDSVILPGIYGTSWVGTVTRLGTTYMGPLAAVVARAGGG